MARRDATSEPVSDGPELGPAGTGEDVDLGAGTAVEATREPAEVENGTLGTEGSTGASKEESERVGNFGLGFTEGYEDPILLAPPASANDEAHETRGYGPK